MERNSKGKIDDTPLGRLVIRSNVTLVPGSPNLLGSRTRHSHARAVTASTIVNTIALPRRMKSLLNVSMFLVVPSTRLIHFRRDRRF